MHVIRTLVADDMYMCWPQGLQLEHSQDTLHESVFKAYCYILLANANKFGYKLYNGDLLRT